MVESWLVRIFSREDLWSSLLGRGMIYRGLVSVRDLTIEMIALAVSTLLAMSVGSYRGR